MSDDGMIEATAIHIGNASAAQDKKTKMQSTAHSLIVGGTRGIGRAVTRLFAEAGHQVSAIGLHDPDPRDRDTPNTRFWRADMSDAQDRSRVLNDIFTGHGRVNYLVFLQRYRGDDDPWMGELETTLTATKATIDAVAGEFVEAGDRGITIVGSILGERIANNQPVGYHVAKVGLQAMMRYYAVNLGQQGIRVNSVAPSTTLKEESKQFYLSDPELLRRYALTTPLGRMGTAEDVSSVVLFLCSNQAAFVTGQVINVDGGASLVWQQPSPVD